VAVAELAPEVAGIELGHVDWHNGPRHAPILVLDADSDLPVRGRRNGDRNHETRLTARLTSAASSKPEPQEETMFGSIVVGTDGSDTATTAVRYAVDLARELGARLQIVSAYEPVPDQRLRNQRIEVPKDLQWMVNPHEDVLVMLEQAAEEARTAGVQEVETFARQGDAADAILDVAEEQRSDLIVVGNKGMTGAKRFLLGSVPNKVSHHAPCSVLVVRTT
jgi:nucleotide-binding universal stress UspA family protein